MLDSALRVAGYLESIGVREGDRVSIVLPNSPQFIAAYFGILMRGAAVVPINPLYKAGEINYMLGKSRTKVVFTLDLFQDEVLKAVEGTSVEKVIVSNIADHLPPAKRVLGKLLRKVPSKPIRRNRMVETYRRVLSSSPISKEEVVRVDPSTTPAAICFTSGTTGCRRAPYSLTETSSRTSTRATRSPRPFSRRTRRCWPCFRSSTSTAKPQSWA
jgi:Acyl-CoA synthetases (AMP-forming)/AMP-acid ligases II